MKKETISIKFQDKYKDLFEKLDREAETEDDRWTIFTEDKRRYDEFYADFYLDWCYYYYKDDIFDMDNNVNEEKVKKRDTYSGEIFQNAMKKAIRKYDLNKALFFTFFTTIYRNEQIDEEQKTKGITSTMMALILAVQKIQKSTGMSSAKDIIYAFGDIFEKENICKVFKADGTLADVPQKVVDYLDKKMVSFDEEGFKEPEPLPDDKFFEDEDEKNLEDRVKDAVREYLECEIIAMKAKPQKWEFYRAFWTRDIMQRMKLEEGKPYKSTPAGDPDEYKRVKKMFGPLWYQMSYKPYIQEIIKDKPKDLEYLYGQYYNLLKRADIGKNQILSEIMGESVQRLYLQEKKSKENYEAWKKHLEQGILEIFRTSRW